MSNLARRPPSRTVPAPVVRGSAPPPYRMPAPQAAPEGRLNFSDIWQALREGWWVIVLTALVVAGAVAAYTFTVTPTYESSSLVRLSQLSSAPAGSNPQANLPPVSQDVAALQTSLDMAKAVLDSIEVRDSLLAAAGQPGQFPFLAEYRTLPVRQRAAVLIGHMEFFGNPQQSTITISAQSASPDEAAGLASAYASVYQRYSRDLRRRNVVSQKRYLEDQFEKRRRELDSLGGIRVGAETGEAAVASSGQVGGTAGLMAQSLQFATEASLAAQRLAQYQAELDELSRDVRPQLSASQDVATLGGQIAQVETQIAPARTEVDQWYRNDPSLRARSDAELAADPGYARLVSARQRLTALEAQKEQLQEQLFTAQEATSGGGPSSLGRVQELRRLIATQRIEVNGARNRKANVDAQIGQAQSATMSLPGAAINAERIQNEYSLVQNALNSAYNSLLSIRLQEESEVGYVTLLQEAFIPTTPVKPKKTENMVLGTLLGFALGIGLAFVRRATTRQLRNPEDLKDHGFQLIGVIPPMTAAIKSSFDGKPTIEIEGRTRSTSLLPLLDPWSPIAENYRFVRTNLRHLRGSGDVQVLMVTSPSMSDGKTTTCVNLAVTSAQGGLRTLLIEADLRRPGAAKLLGFDRAEGLAEILEGERWPTTESTEGTASRFYRFATDIEHLWFVSAGKPTVPPAELLGTPTMQAFLDAARRVFDVIVIDTPPVLAVTDPVILAPHVDAVALVISNDRTDLRALDVTRTTLEAVGARIAGVIVNRFDERKAGGATGPYQYGYYTTSYGPDSNAPAA